MGITYDEDLLRLMDAFINLGFYVGSVVITQYGNQPNADLFRQRLDAMGVKSYLHYPIEGYPHDIAHIVSDEGYGKNDYVETSRPLVVVTAPGPGSGKMATCLSQLYHENKRGVKAGYAKCEPFPIWNLPLDHPVNIAYEAATVDLDDVNAIDPFHLAAYGETHGAYNRDISLPRAEGHARASGQKAPTRNPTDMGVNASQLRNRRRRRPYARPPERNRAPRAQTAEEVRRTGVRRGPGRQARDHSEGGRRRREPAHKAALDRKAGRRARRRIRLMERRVITGHVQLGAASSVCFNAMKAQAGIPDDMYTSLQNEAAKPDRACAPTCGPREPAPSTGCSSPVVDVLPAPIAPWRGRALGHLMVELKRRRAYFAIIASDDEQLYRSWVTSAASRNCESHRYYHRRPTSTYERPLFSKTGPLQFKGEVKRRSGAPIPPCSRPKDTARSPGFGVRRTAWKARRGDSSAPPGLAAAGAGWPHLPGSPCRPGSPPRATGPKGSPRAIIDTNKPAGGSNDMRAVAIPPGYGASQAEELHGQQRAEEPMTRA